MGKNIKALLIGVGNIGARYDWDSSDTKTYAKAFANDRDVSFDIYDPFAKNCLEVAERYRAKIITEFTKSNLSKYDLVVIASPTETHFAYLKKLIEFQTKLIICEKPVSDKIFEIEALEKLVKDFNGIVFVNYFRNFQPKFIELKNYLEKLLPVQNCKTISIEYQRGFHNNASHALYLVEFLLDGTIEFEGATKLRATYDEFSTDATSTIYCKIGEADIAILGLANVQFSHLNLSFFLDKSIIRILDAGNTIEIYEYAYDQRDFYPHLKLSWRMENAIANSIENIVKKVKSSSVETLTNDGFFSACSLSKKILKLENSDV